MLNPTINDPLSSQSTLGPNQMFAAHLGGHRHKLLKKTAKLNGQGDDMRWTAMIEAKSEADRDVHHPRDTNQHADVSSISCLPRE
jgi:hypothetical protein